jgi:hypothetical protein
MPVLSNMATVSAHQFGFHDYSSGDCGLAFLSNQPSAINGCLGALREAVPLPRAAAFALTPGFDMKPRWDMCVSNCREADQINMRRTTSISLRCTIEPVIDGISLPGYRMWEVGVNPVAHGGLQRESVIVVEAAVDAIGE